MKQVDIVGLREAMVNELASGILSRFDRIDITAGISTTLSQATRAQIMAAADDRGIPANHDPQEEADDGG